MIIISLYIPKVYYYFFFQAEDGIRDFHVTGVQTCALPILVLDPQQGIVTPQGEQADALDQLAELAVAIVARVEFRHLLGDVTTHRPEIGPAIIPRRRIYGLAEQVAQLGILAQFLAAAAGDGALVSLGGRGAAVVALQEDLGIDEAVAGGHQ